MHYFIHLILQYIRVTRVTISLTIGLCLLLSNYGQEWEVGHIVSKTPYKAGSHVQINGSIGVKIGLRSVNVTLKSDTPEELIKEVIDYNERFEWTWDQGRFGFGPYAGHLQQQFRAAQYRGVPTPILWIVDYFVIDGEGFRHGRFYRTAGWYSHIALWWAFALWLLANILFRSVLRFGAYCLALTGVLQLTANLIWLVVRNPIPLVIPFEDQTLITKFGPSYWLTFVMGIICLVISGAIIFMDYKYVTKLYMIFDISPLNIYDEVVYLTKEERAMLRPKNKSSEMPLLEMNSQADSEEDDEYVPVYLKSKAIIHQPPRVDRAMKPTHLVNLATKSSKS